MAERYAYGGYGAYNHPPSLPPPARPGPNYRWWIPENDIRRDVIQADIQRYLGQDALVKPGEGIGENKGRHGYWIAAYMNLTTWMQEDLRADSINFVRQGAKGKYEDSTIHKSRQYYGSTDDQLSSSAAANSQAAPSTYSSASGNDSSNRSYTNASSYRQSAFPQSTDYTYLSARDWDYDFAPAHQPTVFPVAPFGYYPASDGRYYPLQTTKTLRPSTKTPGISATLSSELTPSSPSTNLIEPSVQRPYYLSPDGRSYPLDDDPPNLGMERDLAQLVSDLELGGQPETHFSTLRGLHEDEQRKLTARIEQHTVMRGLTRDARSIRRYKSAPLAGLLEDKAEAGNENEASNDHDDGQNFDNIHLPTTSEDDMHASTRQVTARALTSIGVPSIHNHNSGEHHCDCTGRCHCASNSANAKEIFAPGYRESHGLPGHCCDCFGGCHCTSQAAPCDLGLRKEVPLICPRCEVAFPTGDRYKTHIKTHGANHLDATEQELLCTEFPPCHLSFTRNKDLVQHIRNHTSERPFQCHCSRRFHSLDNLKRHAQAIHIGEHIPTYSLSAGSTQTKHQIFTDGQFTQITSKASSNTRVTSGSEDYEDDESISSLSNLSDEVNSIPEHLFSEIVRHSLLQSFLYDVVYRVSKTFAPFIAAHVVKSRNTGTEDEGAGQNIAASTSQDSSSTKNKRAHDALDQKSDEHGTTQGGDDDDSEEENDDHRKRQRTNPSPKNITITLKLACPYYKRDPKRHQEIRSCKGPGWDTAHRVKEHLYRTHAIPSHCPRCNSIFQSEADLSDHLRQDDRCQRTPKADFTGFNKDQEKKLKSKKKKPGLTEPERWVEIYRILFPEDDQSQIPSPYLDLNLSNYEHLTKFKNYLDQELPTRLLPNIERDLEGMVPENYRDMLLARIQESVRVASEDVLQTYSLQIKSDQLKVADSKGKGRALDIPRIETPTSAHDTSSVSSSLFSSVPTKPHKAIVEQGIQVKGGSQYVGPHLDPLEIESSFDSILDSFPRNEHSSDDMLFSISSAQQFGSGAIANDCPDDTFDFGHSFEFDGDSFDLLPDESFEGLWDAIPS